LIRQPISTRRRVALAALSILILVAGYWSLAYRQHVRNPDDQTIPTFAQLADGVRSAFQVHPRTGERWVLVDALATGERLFLGLALGVTSAVLLGLLMGCYTSVEAFLHAPLTILAKVPPTAALAVFFVMVGTDTEMYVTMIAFGVLPTLAQSVHLAVRDVPMENTDKALTLGASPWEVPLSVVLPQILPKVIDGVRLQIGPALVYLIAAEMVCGDIGFGYRIRLQSRLLNMSLVYPYLALLAGFGFLMDGGLRMLVRRCCPWYAGSTRS